jgi:hypothetical protein
MPEEEAKPDDETRERACQGALHENRPKLRDVAFRQAARRTCG